MSNIGQTFLDFKCAYISFAYNYEGNKRNTYIPSLAVINRLQDEMEK